MSCRTECRRQDYRTADRQLPDCPGSRRPDRYFPKPEAGWFLKDHPATRRFRENSLTRPLRPRRSRPSCPIPLSRRSGQDFPWRRVSEDVAIRYIWRISGGLNHVGGERVIGYRDLVYEGLVRAAQIFDLEAVPFPPNLAMAPRYQLVPRRADWTGRGRLRGYPIKSGSPGPSVEP
jgi:hypothetical protein